MVVMLIVMVIILSDWNGCDVDFYDFKWLWMWQIVILIVMVMILSDCDFVCADEILLFVNGHWLFCELLTLCPQPDMSHLQQPLHLLYAHLPWKEKSKKLFLNLIHNG